MPLFLVVLGLQGQAFLCSDVGLQAFLRSDSCPSWHQVAQDENSSALISDKKNSLICKECSIESGFNSHFEVDPIGAISFMRWYQTKSLPLRSAPQCKHRKVNSRNWMLRMMKILGSIKVKFSPARVNDVTTILSVTREKRKKELLSHFANYAAQRAQSHFRREYPPNYVCISCQAPFALLSQLNAHHDNPGRCSISQQTLTFSRTVGMKSCGKELKWWKSLQTEILRHNAERRHILEEAWLSVIDTVASFQTRKGRRRIRRVTRQVKRRRRKSGEQEKKEIFLQKKNSHIKKSNPNENRVNLVKDVLHEEDVQLLHHYTGSTPSSGFENLNNSEKKVAKEPKVLDSAEDTAKQILVVRARLEAAVLATKTFRKIWPPKFEVCEMDSLYNVSDFFYHLTHESDLSFQDAMQHLIIEIDRNFMNINSRHNRVKRVACAYELGSIAYLRHK